MAHILLPHQTKTGSIRRAAPYMVAMAVVGVVILAASFAAGPLSALEPEAGSLSGGAVAATVSGASAGQAVRFNAAVTPSPSPAPTSAPSTSKPTAANTGYGPTALTVVTGDQTYATDGAVIAGKDIHGYVHITGKNITIKNSIIRGGTKPCTSSNVQNSAALWIDASASNAVVQDSEISPSNATACMDGIWASNVTLTRLNIHGSVDGVKAYDGTTMQDSYVHDLAYFASDPNQNGGETHNDAVQTYECNSNILINHNNLDLSTGQGGNAAYQITQDGGQRCVNLVISNNWIDGGGCSINIAHKTLATLAGVSITGNRFGRHRDYAGCTVLLSTKSTLAAYMGNVWDDTGLAVPAPQVHD